MLNHENKDRFMLVTVPMVAVLLPVLGVQAVDHDAFLSVFGTDVVHLFSELFCMFLAIGTAGFMLLRHSGSRTGAHFWFSCGLLIQSTFLGFHAILIDHPVSELQALGSVFFGGLVTACMWFPARERRGWFLRSLPALFILFATMASSAVQIWGADLLPLFGKAAGSVPGAAMHDPLIIAASVFYVASGLRIAISLVRRRSMSLLWAAVFCFMMAAAVVMLRGTDEGNEPWLFHLTRVCAFTILMAYIFACTSVEFRRLGSTETQLRQSEMRFKAITENTSDIVFVLDSSGVFSYVSPAAARLTGLKPEDLLGREPGGYTNDEDKGKVKKGLEAATASPGESIRIGTIRVRHTDGHWLYVEGVYTCLDDDPSVGGTVLNYRDVTDRLHSEKALRQSRGRLDRLIGNLPGMVYRMRASDFKMEYVSEYSHELLGFTPQEFVKAVDDAASKVVHPDDFDRMRRTIREAADTASKFHVEYRVFNSEGQMRWVLERGACIQDEVGVVRVIEGIVMDITDLVHSRRELRRTKFSVDNAMDALYWIGNDGRIIEVNQTACKYLGYSRDELLAMSIHDISVDLGRGEWSRVWNFVKQEGAVLVEGEHVTKTGRRFPVEVSSIFLEFEGEEYHCCFVRDISERKEAERQIQRMNQNLEKRVRERTAALEEAQDKLVTSEKMAALGGLVAGVAHEINTPLGIGVTAASHLDKKVEECSSLHADGRMKRSDFESFMGLARETSGLILTNLRRAADLVQGFKQVSVDQSSERRRIFDLKDYLDEVVVSLHPEISRQGHNVELNCGGDMRMDSYPGAIAQVATNLIMNSVKHGFEGRRDGNIWINVDGVGDRICILYKDDGVGMEQEQVRKLYDPFFTTKRGRGGSGLGMNITYNLITQMLKGTIDCQSAPGQGVVFMVEFPRATPEDPKAERAAAEVEVGNIEVEADEVDEVATVDSGAVASPAAEPVAEPAQPTV